VPKVSPLRPTHFSGYALHTRSAHSAKLVVVHNRLTELPSLTKNVDLRMIQANNNELQRLPNLKTNVELRSMYIYSNRLTKYVCACTCIVECVIL